MTTTKNFTELDYDGIRQSIVEHLKTKTEFEDFNFEGPGISLLVDALAYTATYTALHANMAVTETFLDSAQLRNSLVSKAKELNYTPRSVQAPFIEMDLVFTHPDRDLTIPKGLGLNLVVPRGTTFSVNIGTNAFDFVTTEQFSFVEEFEEVDVDGNPEIRGGIYRAPIKIYQGTLKTIEARAPQSSTERVSERFLIPDQDIDTRFLNVQTSLIPGGDDLIEWQNFDNIVNVGPSTQAYYLQEGLDGFYEIYFGDGIIARILDPQADIYINYLVTDGPESHGIGTNSTIELNGEGISALVSANEDIVNDAGAFQIENSNPAREGAVRETNESIRLAAPRNYQAQNRAVTRDDYITLLQNKYGFIKTMSVWGGEDNVPPRYGTTFICIKPNYGDRLSPVTKQNIEEDLVANHSIVSITPRVVDPDSVYVFLTANVAYRSEETSLSQGLISQTIQNNIKDFFENNVTYFNRTLRNSRLLRTIDDSNSSIQGSTVDLMLAKIFNPDTQRAVEVDLNFYNPLVPGTVQSRPFSNLSGEELQLRDNSKGRMHLYVNDRISLRDIATVDYEEGRVLINGLRSTQTRRFIFRVPLGTEVIIEGEPTKKDIRSERSGIIELRNSELTVNLNRLTYEED